MPNVRVARRPSIFNRNGLATLSDINTEEWKDIFLHLKIDQDYFLLKESFFRSPEYKWPRNPLYNWSRIWEYPYVFHHLETKINNTNNFPRVIDVGSGVTFFPFSVAKLGYHVTCTDVDPICETDILKAVRFADVSPGKIDFVRTDGKSLMFDDETADIIYSISVIEHIPDFIQTLSEIERVLKPGGLFLLTIDLDLQGDSEIGVEKYKLMTEFISLHFSSLYPDSTIHPADMLTTDNSLYPFNKLEGPRFLWYLLKREVKRLFEKKPKLRKPALWTVCGFALVKK